MTINATVCICSYLHTSFCTNSQELLRLNISVPKSDLHKEVHCKQVLLWETALGNPAQQFCGESREHPHQKPGQGTDSRIPHTLPPPSARPSPKPPFRGWSRHMTRSPPVSPWAHGKDNAQSSAGLVKNQNHFSRPNTSNYQPPPLTPAQEGLFSTGHHQPPDFT